MAYYTEPRIVLLPPGEKALLKGVTYEEADKDFLIELFIEAMCEAEEKDIQANLLVQEYASQKVSEAYGLNLYFLFGSYCF
jgi:hypothetical protein